MAVKGEEKDVQTAVLATAMTAQQLQDAQDSALYGHCVIMDRRSSVMELKIRIAE